MLVNSTNSATVTVPMIPSGSHQTNNAKRKAMDAETNPLLAAAKRLKKDKSTSNKRKLLSAEEPGSGLIIVRAPPPNGPFSSSQPVPSTLSSTYNPPRPSSSQPISRTSPSPFSASSSSQQHPPNKKFRASSAQPSSSRYPHPAPSPVPEEAEVEEAVRAMNDEADSLRSARRQSHVPTMMDQNINPAFQFSRLEPERGKKSSSGKAKAKEILVDTSAPIEQDESPQIQRNKRLREGAMAAIAGEREGEPGNNDGRGRGDERGTNHRRRSSLSRGKRISSGFDLTGVITSPHNSVSAASFYKHIDSDLPDSERLRQLLIWSTIRASGTTTFSSSSTPSKPSSLPSSAALQQSAQNLPPLSDKAKEVLRAVQDDLVRKLAGRKIDLSLYGGPSQPEAGPSSASGSGGKLKENEQNLKNKDFEVKYSQEIRQLEEEEDQWKKVSYRYEEYSKRFSQAMEKRVADAQAQASAMSAKAKGKQRLIVFERDEELDEMLPDPSDLPPDLRPSIDLIRTALLPPPPSPHLLPSLTSHVSRPTAILTTHRNTTLTRSELASTISQLLPDVPFKLDQLHTFVNCARMTTRVAEMMLDERNKILVDNLERRRVGSSSSTEGGAGGNMDVAKNYVQKEILPLHVRDATPSTSDSGSAPGVGGLMDLMRALSRIDTARHPSQIGDQARRAAREVARIGDASNYTSSNSHAATAGAGTASVGGESSTSRRLTAVYPAGILNSGNNSHGNSVVMTPRKVPGTPRRHGTPGRERTPGR